MNNHNKSVLGLCGSRSSLQYLKHFRIDRGQISSTSARVFNVPTCPVLLLNQIWSNMCRTSNNMPTHFPELQPVVPEIWLNETLVVFTVITATWPRSPQNTSVPNFAHSDWVTRRCCELPVWTASCIANWANSPHHYLFWWYSTGCQFFPDLVTFLTTF